MSDKKGLKISNTQSHTINRRRTDNTMVNRKRTKGQKTIYKTIRRKPNIEQHEQVLWYSPERKIPKLIWPICPGFVFFWVIEY